MRSLIFMLFAFYSLNAFSQTGTIRGKVMDEKGKPIEGANVMLQGTITGTSTDDAGNYYLEIPSGSSSIKFSYIGKATVIKKVTIEANARQYINVNLSNGGDGEGEQVNVNGQATIDFGESNKSSPNSYTGSSDYKLLGKITPKAAFLYCTSVFGEDYTSSQYAKKYLKYFDNNYRNYSGDEFELSRKINDAKATLKNEVTSLSFNTVYVAEFKAKLGEYDFQNGRFAFTPFVFGNNQVCESAFPYGNVQGDYFTNIGFYLKNDGVQWLKMDEQSADRVVKSFPKDDSWGGSKVNRTVYIKAYYSIMKDVDKSNGNRPYKILCYLHKLEVYTDKCMNSNQIASINATFPAPSYLGAMHDKFVADTKNGVPEKLVPFNQELTKNQMFFSSIGYIPGANCNKALYKVKVSFNQKDAESYVMLLDFQTNAKVSIMSGFFYTFTDMSGQDYPLVVKETHTEAYGYSNDGTPVVVHVTAEINIKKNILKMFADKGISRIRFQVRSTNERPGGYGFSPPKESIDVGSGEWFQWNITEADRNQFKNIVYKSIQ